MALGKGKFDQMNLKPSGLLVILCVYERTRHFERLSLGLSHMALGKDKFDMVLKYSWLIILFSTRKTFRTDITKLSHKIVSIEVRENRYTHTWVYFHTTC